jgi:hypothetical protein
MNSTFIETYKHKCDTLNKLPICGIPMPTVLLQKIVGETSETNGLCTTDNEDDSLLVISDYESIMAFITKFVLADCWAVTHSINGKNTVADVLYNSYNDTEHSASQIILNNVIRCTFAKNPHTLLSLDIKTRSTVLSMYMFGARPYIIQIRYNAKIDTFSIYGFMSGKFHQNMIIGDK